MACVATDENVEELIIETSNTTAQYITTGGRLCEFSSELSSYFSANPGLAELSDTDFSVAYQAINVSADGNQAHVTGFEVTIGDTLITFMEPYDRAEIVLPNGTQFELSSAQLTTALFGAGNSGRRQLRTEPASDGGAAIYQRQLLQAEANSRACKINQAICAGAKTASDKLFKCTEPAFGDVVLTASEIGAACGYATCLASAPVPIAGEVVCVATLGVCLTKLSQVLVCTTQKRCAARQSQNLPLPG